MDDPETPEPPGPPRPNSGVVLGLVALALVLAVGFFYLTNDDRRDRRADAVTQAAA